MANRVEGVEQRVLECAKVEFMDKGFTEASLRTIAQNANTSTGSIYTRFKDKEGLFEAVVDPAIKALGNWFIEQQEHFHKLPTDYQARNSYNYAAGLLDIFVDYLYKYFDLFKLLVTGAAGTKFSEFINYIAEIDVEYTIKYLEVTSNDAILSGRVSTKLIHIISSAFYTGLFEIVIHDMPKDEAYEYAHQLKRFFIHGWKNILLGDDEE